MDIAVEDVTARWVRAWTTGRTTDLFKLLAAAPAIETNLDPDGDFIELLTDYAAAVESVTVFSQTVLDRRAALVYDCTLSGETFRLAEFLTVNDVGLVTEVRRVYDLNAIERLMPHLLLEH
ncbi:hypothetical protein [Dactylosporangium matsuzakiense]|uniref:SnoaL-like domain-containing protein n=1 Tax=Dactylosporangium matsuzakiense TaxID=53360 RepID=A0A9W6NPE3_9ACTN|nr:hypothetical protein [Dactylosporangium matsuzakiense]UWZ46884.1 hypothetical protein Dmats_10980 [Dactylosporangium matsuzakiense]GLL04228.1 hypothetical protein GCM10017581_059750 [Dactylosporangium matsuzakiense]